MRIASILFLYLALNPLSSARGEHVMVLGHGNSSCGDWTEARTDKNPMYRTAYEAWVNGFLTGLNYTDARDDHNLTYTSDMAGMQEWISNYCAAFPLNTIYQAAEALFVTLAHRNESRLSKEPAR